MLSGVDQWFATEILPHEGLLNGYLMRVWHDSSEVDDLMQEVYVRVYERARRELPRQPKAFLFATARNLMSDQLRRRRILSINAIRETDGLETMIDEISPERSIDARQELSRLAHAFNSLSEKCRDVVWFRRVEGLSQRETADRMGLKEAAIESQLARGIRTLARAIFRAADEHARHSAEEKDRNEPDR